MKSTPFGVQFYVLTNAELYNTTTSRMANGPIAFTPPPPAIPAGTCTHPLWLTLPYSLPLAMTNLFSVHIACLCQNVT